MQRKLDSRELIIGFGTALLFAPWLQREAEPGPQQAAVQLALLVASVALSYAAGYLLRKKNKATLKDDKPTTLVSRGSYVTWLVGIRRLAPMVAWVGKERNTKEKSGKKGGLGGQKVKVWHEEGIHLLCIGPAYALHKIFQNGEVIFDGPITSDSHPSGSFVDIGSEGGFIIYWGEPTQPPNTRAGTEDRLGVTSRWPYHCYVHWSDKKLGQAKHWPLLEYEVEVRIPDDETNLSDTEPTIPPTRTAGTDARPILAVDTAGSTDYFELEGSLEQEFEATGFVRLEGNQCPDTDLETLFSESLNVEVSPLVFQVRTRVHFTAGTLDACDDAGTLTAYVEEANGGSNAAHAIDRMVHGKWPYGLNLPRTTERAVFDMDSLEALGTLTLAEGLRTSWIALDGDTVQQVLGAGLQDLGCLIPMDWSTGLIKFVPVREPTGTLRRVRETLLRDGLPEVETLQAGRPQSNQVTFVFPDRRLSDRDQPLTFAEDGLIAYTETQRSRKLQITISTDFDTSSAIAVRRSQEELGRGPAVKFTGARKVRQLLPGEAFLLDGVAELQRCLEVGRGAETGLCEVECMADYYGVPISPFLGNKPPIPGGSLPVQADIQKAIVEVPEYVLGTEDFTVLVPRIRAHAAIYQAGIYLSRTNSSYTLIGQELDFQTGGTLLDPLPASGAAGAMLLDQGPRINALGPDIEQVLDLSSDIENWTVGRQLCVILSTAGVEICFLQAVTGIGGSEWRLDGLLRARWDTLSLAHPAGAEVYIFEQASILGAQDPLLAVGQDIYGKTQPQGNGILPLDADIPEQHSLRGKGRAGPPIAPSGFEVSAPRLSNAVYASEDLSFQWTYSNALAPSTGAGMFPAGQAIQGYSAVDGDFLLEFLTTGDVVVRTESLTNPTYTYTAANIATDFGSNNFKARLRQRRNGLLSEPQTITIENYA